MIGGWSQLEPLLAAIHARLDERLELRTLARLADVSPFRVHRLFKALLGETPRAYVERQRLERARFRLLVQDAPLTRIALDCGFEHVDSFARAFRRRYGRSPSAWRQGLRRRSGERSPPDLSCGEPASHLSTTRPVRLQTLHLATLRHLGPYESVPESLFDRLAAWAVRRGLPGPRVWMGIGHDAPSATASEQLRFDAALVVGAPFDDGDDGVVHRVLPGGEFALTTAIGPYAALPAAYGRILERLLAHPHWVPIGLPAVEVYHTHRVAVGAALNHTDICLPIALR
jgi:AraC family transcriptional regulator